MLLHCLSAGFSLLISDTEHLLHTSRSSSEKYLLRFIAHFKSRLFVILLLSWLPYIFRTSTSFRCAVCPWILLLAALPALLMVSFALQKPPPPVASVVYFCLCCLCLTWKGNARSNIKELPSHFLTVVWLRFLYLSLYPFPVDFCTCGVVGSNVIASACRHPVSLAPLWKRLPSPYCAFLAPLSAAGTANSWVYFWTFHSFPFVYIPIFMPAPSYLYHSSLVADFEIH